MDSFAMRDHCRPIAGDYPDGIYRVVGTGEDTVTLLRVGDANGRRANTGEIVTVRDDDLEAFEPAENPDGNRPLGVVVGTRVEMLYWQLRAFGQQLAAHPLPAAVAGVLVLIGFAGEDVVPLPGIALTLALVAGSLGFVLVGSGRL